MGAALVLAVCGQRAAGEDVPRLTFAQLVDSIRANFEVTQALQTTSDLAFRVGFALHKDPAELPENDVDLVKTPLPAPAVGPGRHAQSTSLAVPPVEHHFDIGVAGARVLHQGVRRLGTPCDDTQVFLLHIQPSHRSILGPARVEREPRR